MSARAVGLLALALAAVGCAGRPAGIERAAIVGGSDDAGDGAVVALVDRRTSCEQSSVHIVCTGTLIAPRVVLTAAHCLQEQGTDGTWEVYVGSPVAGDAAGRFVAVTATAVDPAWDRTTHAFDLALLQLSDDAGMTPVPLATAPLPASLVGATVRVVGYGETMVGVQPDGMRRQATLQVASIDADTFRADAAPGNSCGGDSGGPVLGDAGAGEQLLGVTVAGDVSCTAYADQARVDVAMADFIQPFLDATAAAPAGRPAGAIDAGALCRTSCASDADCPAALVCEPATADWPATCSLSEAPPVAYGAVCAHDSDCGGGASCARLWPDGADACRCATSCAGGPPPIGGGGGTGGGHGCAVGGDDAGPWWTLVLALAVIAARRRRDVLDLRA